MGFCGQQIGLGKAQNDRCDDYSCVCSSTSGAGGGGMLSGWVPIFDTMHGIRGEINFIVKVRKGDIPLKVYRK